MSVNCARSVIFSGFLHQENWPLRYSWNIVESGVNHHNPSPKSNHYIISSMEIDNLQSKYIVILFLVAIVKSPNAITMTFLTLRIWYRHYNPNRSFLINCDITVMSLNLHFNELPDAEERFYYETVYQIMPSGKKCFITELLIYICIVVIKGSLFNI